MNGIRYLLRGLSMLSTPGIRPFVILPITINLVIFIVLTSALFTQFSQFSEWLNSYLASWLTWLSSVITLLAGILWLLLYGYFFSVISNVLAAPFYGLLAERVESRLRQLPDQPPLTMQGLLALAGKSFVREWLKMRYLLPRFIGVLVITLLLSFIPVVGLMGTVIYFLWGSWALALENADYSADNNGVSFDLFRQACSAHRYSTLGFGAASLFLVSIPVINLFAMPAAVAGGTLLWVEKLSNQCIETPSTLQ
jgi:CysZ protein